MKFFLTFIAILLFSFCINAEENTISLLCKCEHNEIKNDDLIATFFMESEDEKDEFLKKHPNGIPQPFTKVSCAETQEFQGTFTTTITIINDTITKAETSVTSGLEGLVVFNDEHDVQFDFLGYNKFKKFYMHKLFQLYINKFTLDYIFMNYSPSGIEEEIYLTHDKSSPNYYLSSEPFKNKERLNISKVRGKCEKIEKQL